VGKNLDIERFRDNLEYIVKKHPGVILETNMMMGFPTETEGEARMSLDFIKQQRWIDFPNLNILKIYADTGMERLALDNGISREAIENSFNRAYHELPDTLPFAKRFAQECQAELLNEYFLKRERLLAVLPHQAKVLSEDEMAQKYDSYLPAEIKSCDELLDFFGITRRELGLDGAAAFLDERTMAVPDFNEKMRGDKAGAGGQSALRVLLLDLSKTFSSGSGMLYDVIESPLGLMVLLTYLNRELGDKIHGKIAHARMDFDNYEELRALVSEFRPDVIGVRTLTFYKDFYHETIAALRRWGVEAPVIAGGPYASSDWAAVLQDANIDLAVIGEGEITFAELIGKMIENQGKLPGEEVLKNIPGLAFIPGREKNTREFARDIVMMDLVEETSNQEPAGVVPRSSVALSTDPAYVIFTSGSTGAPRGTVTTHYNVVRVVRETNYIDLRFGDRLLQLSNYAFDGSVFDIYGALLNGAILEMISREQVLNLDRLSQILKQRGITVFFLTTALFNALVDFDPGSLAGVGKVLFGGERVSVDHVRRALARMGPGKILHMYGPTETTVYASFYPVDHIEQRQETIPIGRPLSNTVIYILDNNLKPLPLGVSGELYIGGRGNAPGYLNNPELTQNKFIKQKFLPGSRGRFFQKEPPGRRRQNLYRTGDLARWTLDGNIEFVGRIDHQVKIRGFRIEPGEIENHLIALEPVEQAAVIAREDDGDRYLCAYVVLSEARRGDTGPGELKDRLARDLPGYMVPAHLFILDALPLTANGKVDRGALPLPGDAGGDAVYAAPTSELEKKLADTWSEVLGIEVGRIGIDSDFFQLGGHSLRATVLLARIRKQFQVEIPLADLFKAPFIRQLAATIQQAAAAGFSAVQPAEKREYYMLSPAQERLYVLQQMIEDNIVYNVPQAVEIQGPLVEERLQTTVNKLVERHESLRTSFHMMGKEPVQRVHDEARVDIEFPGKDKEAISRFVRPFDLSRAPLLRVGLAKLAKDRHILVVDMHHIITDGTSVHVFISEALALYAGRELPQLRVQYKDFAQWQRQEEQQAVIGRQGEFWLKQFQGELPVLNLPLDYPRPAVQSFAGSTVEFELPARDAHGLSDLGARQGATLYMTLLALTCTLFYKLSHQEDMVIGTPIAARRHADLEPVIGMFVNTLALRNYPTGQLSFSQFLDNVKANTLEALENQEYPFEELVEKVSANRDASRSPLFDVVFALQNMESRTGDFSRAGIGELTLTPYALRDSTAKFDLTLVCAGVEGGLLCTFEYCGALFSRETVERFACYFKRIAAAVLANPNTTLDGVDILSEEEKQRLLVDFNRTGAVYPLDKNIHGLFEEQAERTPDGIALEGWCQAHEASVTYEALNGRAGALAANLIERGVQPGDIVGLKVQRSIDMITAVLGILKAGAAYLPIDPGYPRERIDYMLNDSSARLLLINEDVAFPGKIPLPGGVPEGRDGSLAYVIYTSGSTGKPKGVLIDHRNICPLLHWGYHRFGLTSHDRTFQNLSYIFDWSVWEIFITLTSGACLTVPDRETWTDPAAAADFILRNGITVLHATPTQFQYFVKAGKPLPTLDYLFIGAEKLTHNLVRRGYGLVRDDCQVFNMYGPTEAAIISAALEIERDREEAYGRLASVPIGGPSAHAALFILDNAMKVCPVNVAGQLYISGPGLAPGYLNNPGLTAEKFIAISYRSHRSYRTYNTGDLARWLADGTVEFLGRIDRQVKVRGFRIELEEIRLRLVNQDLVPLLDAHVAVKQDQSGDNVICAYVTSDSEVDLNMLSEHLRKGLPAYMTPAHVLRLEKMPLTPTGKIDTRALPMPGATTTRHSAAPNTETEKKLALPWADVLGISPDAVGVDDDFFEIGGNSLKAAALVWNIREAFHMDVPLVELFRLPTIRTLARFIAGRAADTRIVSLAGPVEQNPGTSAVGRLFVIHDGTGEVDGCRELSTRLVPAGNRHILGVRARPLQNYTPQTITIEELAAGYIQEIKKLQPKGPYSIAGWSTGGAIAFEMARQLEEQNQDIALLALIDTVHPRPAMLTDEVKEALAFNLQSERDIIKTYFPDPALAARLDDVDDTRDLWPRVLEHLDAHGFDRQKLAKSIPPEFSYSLSHVRGASARELLYYLNMTRMMGNAADKYVPAGKVQTPVYFFKAASGGAVEIEEWNAYCTRPVTVYEIPGDHYSMLKPPGVEIIAGRLARAMK
jgi:amino acid adenylation domain-containing protein